MFGNFGGFDEDDFFSDPFSRGSRGGNGRGSRNDQIQQRRPTDPFEAMHQRMNQMMGGGFGGMGGDPFADFGNMGGGMQTMSSSSSFGGGPSSFSSSSTMVMSSKRGPDGKMHTERYSSSAVKDGQRDAFEQQQAYSNSSSGIDKMSMERQLRGKGRKMVKEYNHHSQEDRQTEFLKGLDDHEKHEFDQRWQREIAPTMPKHARFGGGGGTNNMIPSLEVGGGGGRRSGQQHARLQDAGGGGHYHGNMINARTSGARSNQPKRLGYH